MIRIFSYSKESKRMETPGLAELSRHIADRGRMIWMDLEDPTDEEIGVLGGIFGFHVLAVEECMQADLLPRISPYDGYTFLTFHAVDEKRAGEELVTDEVDFFVGANYLVSHHKPHVKGIFDTRGQVAKNPGSLLRSPDWLLHGILDAMIDNYAPALQKLGERVEAVQGELSQLPEEIHVQQILKLRQEAYHFSRVAKLAGGCLAPMGQGEVSWISDENRVYFRNLSDRLVRVSHATEFLQHRLTCISETCLSLMARCTYGATRALSVVVASILPLLFIAGIYGMSFSHVPELGWRQGYFEVLGGMVVVLAVILAVLKKKRWF